jgi:hypothetical protein
VGPCYAYHSWFECSRSNGITSGVTLSVLDPGWCGLMVYKYILWSQLLERTFPCLIWLQSNSVIRSWKGLNIVCRYKRGSLQPRSIKLRLTVRN